MTSLTDEVLKAQKDNVRKAIDNFREEYEPLANQYGWMVQGIGYSYLQDHSYKIFVNLQNQKFRWSVDKSFDKFTNMLPKQYALKNEDTSINYPIEYARIIKSEFL